MPESDMYFIFVLFEITWINVFRFHITQNIIKNIADHNARLANMKSDGTLSNNFQYSGKMPHST